MPRDGDEERGQMPRPRDRRLPIGACIRRLLVSVKNQDILNDLSSHFTLARSVLKIASFEFANLLYFNSTFMNLKIARLVLNAKCEVVGFTQSSLQ